MGKLKEIFIWRALFAERFAERNPINHPFTDNKCDDPIALQNEHLERQERLEEMRNQPGLYSINGIGVNMTQRAHDVFERIEMLNAGKDIAANPGGAIGWGVTGTPQGARFGSSAWSVATGLGDRSLPMPRGIQRESSLINIETKSGSHFGGGIKGFNYQPFSNINKPFNRR